MLVDLENARWRKVRRLGLSGALAFLGSGGLYGGALLALDPTGKRIGFPPDMLPKLPVPDYLLPGLVLLSWFGVAPLVCLAGLWIARPESVWRRRAEGLALAFGGTLLLWMALQIALIGFQIPIQAVMTGLGFALVALAAPPFARAG